MWYEYVDAAISSLACYGYMLSSWSSSNTEFSSIDCNKYLFLHSFKEV